MSGLLSFAMPTGLENDCLTLSFDLPGKAAKKMCESNGRKEQIQSVLKEYLGLDLELKFELDSSETGQLKEGLKTAAVNREKRNQIINDPAVKMVLAGLSATITGIEEREKG